MSRNNKKSSSDNKFFDVFMLSETIFCDNDNLSKFNNYLRDIYNNCTNTLNIDFISKKEETAANFWYGIILNWLHNKKSINIKNFSFLSEAKFNILNYNKITYSRNTDLFDVNDDWFTRLNNNIISSSEFAREKNDTFVRGLNFDRDSPLNFVDSFNDLLINPDDNKILIEFKRYGNEPVVYYYQLIWRKNNKLNVHIIYNNDNDQSDIVKDYIEKINEYTDKRDDVKKKNSVKFVRIPDNLLIYSENGEDTENRFFYIFEYKIKSSTNKKSWIKLINDYLKFLSITLFSNHSENMNIYFIYIMFDFHEINEDNKTYVILNDFNNEIKDLENLLKLNDIELINELNGKNLFWYKLPIHIITTFDQLKKTFVKFHKINDFITSYVKNEDIIDEIDVVQKNISTLAIMFSLKICIV